MLEVEGIGTGFTLVFLGVIFLPEEKKRLREFLLWGSTLALCSFIIYCLVVITKGG